MNCRSGTAAPGKRAGGAQPGRSRHSRPGTDGTRPRPHRPPHHPDNRHRAAPSPAHQAEQRPRHHPSPAIPTRIQTTTGNQSAKTTERNTRRNSHPNARPTSPTGPQADRPDPHLQPTTTHSHQPSRHPPDTPQQARSKVQTTRRARPFHAPQHPQVTPGPSPGRASRAAPAPPTTDRPERRPARPPAPAWSGPATPAGPAPPPPGR